MLIDGYGTSCSSGRWARGFAPILLLDEPAVHLDESRRLILFQALRESPAQVVMTGTDAETFLPLVNDAEAWRAHGGNLHQDRRLLTRAASSLNSVTC